MTDPLPTDDTIELPVPSELAADFVLNQSWRSPSMRSLYRLQLGASDVGMWRIEGVASDLSAGHPRMVAKLRRVLE